MANVYSIAFSVVGVIAMHVCILVWTVLLLPKPVARAVAQVESRPFQSWLIGLLSCLGTMAVVGGFLLIRNPGVQFVSQLLELLSERLQFTRFYNDAWIITNGFVWLLALPIIAGFIVGGAAFAQLFALRARSLMREDRPLLGLTIGALCTTAAYFLPLAGWFVFLPIVGLMSIGAGVCGIFGWGARQANRPVPSSSYREDALVANR